MNNFILKINLKKFRNAFEQTIRFGNVEKRCLCIPLQDNDMEEKGNGIYYTALCYYAEHGDFTGKHYIKQYIKSDDFDMMPEEFKSRYEIIGQLTVTDESQMPIVEQRKTPFELNQIKE